MERILKSSSAVITGVGQTPMRKASGKTNLRLQAEAALIAVADAGIQLSDIDGLITVPLGTDSWMMPIAVVADALGMKPDYFATVDVAGASGCAAVVQAKMAIEAGLCQRVLCVGGASLKTFGQEKDLIAHMAETGTAHPQFELPYGPTLASLYALVASKHCHEFGTTEEQLAEIAVAARAYASRNPNARLRELISVDDVMSSRPISTPLKMLDCSIVTDGAAAFILEREDMASDISVRVAGHGQGYGWAYVGSQAELASSAAVISGQKAYNMAGLGPSDIDIAELYDCFTIALLIELEDLGFCEKGEGGRFVASGALGPNGKIPTNTHGGLLSGGHPGLAGGFLHVVEAVSQLKGKAGERQVSDARTALVHGNGGVMGLHSTLILQQGKVK